MLISRCVHVAANGIFANGKFHSFLWLNNIPLYTFLIPWVTLFRWCLWMVDSESLSENVWISGLVSVVICLYSAVSADCLVPFFQFPSDTIPPSASWGVSTSTPKESSLNYISLSGIHTQRTSVLLEPELLGSPYQILARYHVAKVCSENNGEIFKD